MIPTSKLLRIFKFNLITELEIIKPGWMDFDDITCRGVRSVEWPPTFCKDFVDHGKGRIYPEYGEISPNKKHVNGCVYPRVARFDQYKPFICLKLSAKGETLQFTQKIIAIFSPDRRDAVIVVIVN
jgi:hypothetical protein